MIIVVMCNAINQSLCLYKVKVIEVILSYFSHMVIIDPVLHNY